LTQHRTAGRRDLFTAVSSEPNFLDATRAISAAAVNKAGLPTIVINHAGTGWRLRYD